MKKVMLFAVVVAGLMTACSTDGRKVESSEAQEVEVVKEETTATYATVNEGSKMDWRAAHLGGVEPRWGVINLKSAELLVNDNALSNAKVVVDMTSFTVDNFEDEDSKMKLTGHLQSDDFFKVSSFPTSTFELTSVEAGNGEYNSVVSGNLTILDSTKSITFNANIDVSEEAVSIKSEDFVIDRLEWGLTYNTEGTTGVPAEYLISDEVGFTIDVSVGK